LHWHGTALIVWSSYASVHGVHCFACRGVVAQVRAQSQFWCAHGRHTSACSVLLAQALHSIVEPVMQCGCSHAHDHTHLATHARPRSHTHGHHRRYGRGQSEHRVGRFLYDIEPRSDFFVSTKVGRRLVRPRNMAQSLSNLPPDPAFPPLGGQWAFHQANGCPKGLKFDHVHDYSYDG